MLYPGNKVFLPGIYRCACGNEQRFEEGTVFTFGSSVGTEAAGTRAGR